MGEKKNIIMNLVELGKRNQKVTTKEINDALEEIGFEVELVVSSMRHWMRTTTRSWTNRTPT
jgi:hypothetical protein